MVQLNQNPDNRCLMTAGPALNTIIKNVGTLFTPDPEYCRWMTVREMFLAQGFPMYASVKHHGAYCSFDTPKTRHRTAMSEQCGNAMHVHVIGLAVAYPFLFLKLDIDAWNNSLNKPLMKRPSKADVTVTGHSDLHEDLNENTTGSAYSNKRQRYSSKRPPTPTCASPPPIPTLSLMTPRSP